MNTEIGSRSFLTKEHAKAYCRAMLARYEPSETVIANDAYFLCDLLAGHADVERKVGIGVHHFEVRLKRYGARCFYVVRLDGSLEEFSYKKCLARAASSSALAIATA